MGCVDVDECQSRNGGCDALRVCTNFAGGYSCGACAAGYSPSGAVGCVDIDECQSRNGGCDALRVCTNFAGGYSCGACGTGYTANGTSGCVDINECSTNNGGCGAHRTCINSQGAHGCGSCERGYQPDSAGNCTLSTPPPVPPPNPPPISDAGVGPCAINNGGCRPHRICVVTSTGEAECRNCEAGWIGDDTGGCEPL
jgi:hypothetical protein